MSASPLALQPTHLLPPPPAEETWIPYADALKLCRRTPQWLSQQIRENVVRIRLTDRKLGNGRKDREVALSTLPADAQRRYKAQQPSAQALLALVPTGPQLVERMRLHVPAEKMSKAEAKQTILEPILAMKQEHSRRMYAGLRLADGQPVTSQNRMIQYQIEQATSRGESLTERTIKRWLAAHGKEGVAGLARQQRNDAGRSRYFFRPENEAAATLVAALYLGNGIYPGLSVQACFDMLTVQRELVGLPLVDLPSYETVRLFLSQITPALQVFAKKGRKEFGERMMPFLSRAYNEPSNKIWVSDHMIADIWAMNDNIPGAPKGAPIRLRLSAIIDFRSRYVVGYSWAWEESKASIARALRFAVTEHGPCEMFYCDNGKSYLSIAAGAIPGYLKRDSAEAEAWVASEMRSIQQTGVLARLGIQAQHCEPYHPQSKHVERFFRTVHLTFCKLFPTYTGTNPSQRPDQTTALMAQHGKAMRSGDLSKSRYPLTSEVMDRFEAWLPTYQNKRGHRGQGMGHGSPAEVFAQHMNPNQRPAPSHEELAWLMWDIKSATVNECQLRVNQTWYAPRDAWTAQLMVDLNTKRVNVACDPLDLSRVAVLDSAGRLLTMLEAKQLVDMAPDDPETQQQVAGIYEMRKTIRRNMQDRLTNITRAGKNVGVLTPLQLLEIAPAVPEDHNPDRITPRKPQLPSTSAPTEKLNTHDILARFKARKLSGGKP